MVAPSVQMRRQAQGLSHLPSRWSWQVGRMAELEFKPRQPGPLASVSAASESRGFVCSVYSDGAPSRGAVSVCGVDSYSAPDTYTHSLPPFTSFTAHTKRLLLCREGAASHGLQLEGAGSDCRGWLLAAGHWPGMEGGFRAR